MTNLTESQSEALRNMNSESGRRLQKSTHVSRRHSPDREMCLGTYIEQNFIPNHVASKSDAGRIHYHAILKHVLKPEEVERMFARYNGTVKTRLKALPDWPYLDQIPLCDLKADHIRQLTVSASARGYSPQTVKHIRNVVSAVISHARREGLFSGENPVSEIKLPTVLHRKKHSLTIAEAKAVLRLMEYPEREIALMTITTGMSISEICALRWNDINLTDSPVYSDGEVIPPRNALVRRQWSHATIVWSPATRIRRVEIPEPLLRRLQRLMRVQRPFAPAAPVLAHGDGMPLCPAGICARLESIGRQVGIRWLSWTALKRAHQGLLSELRVQLNNELMLGSR